MYSFSFSCTAKSVDWEEWLLGFKANLVDKTIFRTLGLCALLLVRVNYPRPLLNQTVSVLIQPPPCKLKCIRVGGGSCYNTFLVGSSVHIWAPDHFADTPPKQLHLKGHFFGLCMLLYFYLKILWFLVQNQTNKYRFRQISTELYKVI
jgi:hypothetical protein